MIITRFYGVMGNNQDSEPRDPTSSLDKTEFLRFSTTRETRILKRWNFFTRIMFMIIWSNKV